MKKLNFKIKNKKLALSFSIILTIVFSVICGILFTNYSWSKSENKFLNDEKSDNTIFCLPLVNFTDGKTYLDTHNELKSNPEYLGYLSHKAILDSEVKRNDKKIDSLSMILNNDFNTKDFISPDKNFKIENGYLPAYCHGWEWDNYQIGEKLTVKISQKDGTDKAVNVQIAGTFNPQMLDIIFLNINKFKAHKSILAIEGLDINTFVKDPYSQTDFFHNDSNINYADYNFLNYSKLNISYSKNVISYINEAHPLTPLYYLIIMAIVMLLIIWFIGGENRAYYYMGFGVINMIVMIIKLFTTYHKDILYPYFFNTFMKWYNGFMWITLGVTFLLALISFIITYSKHKKIDKTMEESNDSAPKYL